MCGVVCVHDKKIIIIIIIRVNGTYVFYREREEEEEEEEEEEANHNEWSIEQTLSVVISHKAAVENEGSELNQLILLVQVYAAQVVAHLTFLFRVAQPRIQLQEALTVHTEI